MGPAVDSPLQPATTRYPAEREAQVVLGDGSTVQLRPIRRADEGPLTDFIAGLSLRSRAFRFFSGGTDPAMAARAAVRVDYQDSFGLVALSAGRIVGHAMYAVCGPDAVEVAFAVADAWQCHGLGTLMLARIAAIAAANGFEIIEADVLPENRRMLDVFSESRLPFEIRDESGVVHLRTNRPLSEEIVTARETTGRRLPRARRRGRGSGRTRGFPPTPSRGSRG